MNRIPVLSRSISSLLVVGVLGTMTGSRSAHAASATYIGADGVWANGANWSVTPVPGSGDTATFDNAGNGFTTLDLGGGVTINTLLFDTAGVAAYTIGAGAIGSQTLTLNNGGAITVTATVTNNETINSNVVLGTDGAAQTVTVTNDSVTSGELLTIAGGISGSAGVGLKTLAVTGAGNTLLSGIIANGTGGTVGLTKSGNGILTLSGANTFTSNVTLNAGTLNINNASALGNTAAGNLVINGGTLNNTSGAAITTTAAKAMNWNGNFTFAGTNNLSTNLGAVTIGGTAGQRTVNIAGGTLSTGLITAGAGFGLTKTGAGTLFMASTANTSAFAGLLDIQAGTLQTAGDLNVNGGLAGAGTLENGGAAAKWAFVTSPTDTTFSGTIRDNPNNAVARLGFVKRGAGTLNLIGALNQTSDRFAIENGTVRITGTYNAGFAAGAANQVALVGSIANQNGQLIIDGGTFNATRATANAASLAVSSGANTRGFLKMTSGTINTANQFNIGTGSGAVTTRAFGAFSMSGGTLNSGSWLAVGANFDRAVLNQSGGTINVLANRLLLGFNGSESLGVVNLSGGNFNIAAGANSGVFLGENGAGILTLSGTAALTLNTNGAAASGTMQFAGNATSSSGHFNLNGGTLTAFGVTKGASTATGIYRFNFNGGTLQANANNPAFFAELANTSAYVNPGGATINSNGFSITVTEPLLAPTGNGVGSIAVTAGGAGYLDTPTVVLSGGTGTGATAVANVAGGVLTGFTITNPGVDYSPGDVLTATVFGGGATTAASVGTITLTPNVSGGLIKTGPGSLSLTGISTYTGATAITGGTLRVEGSGSIDNSSGISINGTGAKLVQTSFTPIAPLVTVNNGTLDGTTTLNSVVVGDSAGNILTHGDGTTASLTIGSLTFNGSATINVKAMELSPEPFITTNLLTGATNPAGVITINAVNSSGLWSTGVYNLISYSTLGGGGFSKFAKGNIAGLGARQNATLTNPAGFIALSIGGDLPVWTGNQNGNWTTNTIGGASNWKLQFQGTPTDFITGDTVLFDDTATGTTDVVISTANVAPTSTTFNNSALNYTVSSPGGFGISSGTLIKSGTGAATLNTANTYAGGTTLTDGILNLNNSSAIGTGPLNIAGGTIDNTSAGPITLTTNNAQNWTGDFSFGGTDNLNLGTGAVTLASNPTVTTNGVATLTVGGVISGPTFGITKAGPGNLVLSAANTYTGATNVSGGTLTLTGTINASNTPNLGQINVGTSFDDAVLRVAGGTINATKPTAPSVLAGNSGGGTGAIVMDSGSLTATSELILGNVGGALGSFTLNSGSVNFGSWISVGRSGNGVLNVNGGTLNVNTQNLTSGSFGGASGVINLSGGVTSVTSVVATQGNVIVGEGGSGVLNVSGTAVLNASGALGVQLARTGTGIVNLNGGTINTPIVVRGTGSGTFNFDGGTLKATAASATFLQGLTNAYVRPGGAIIDDGGFALTIAQPLLAPTGNGVSATVLTVSGSGFITTPIVQVIGDGVGATAIANIDAGGNLTGITITNPGVDYTTEPTFALVGGGSANTGFIDGLPTLVANTSGGLTKRGAGTLTLTGDNTYTGPTDIIAGTLVLANATGSATGTGAVNVNGGTTLTGAGSAAGTVAVASGGTLTPGNVGVGTLTTGGLTLSAGSLLNYEFTDASARDLINVTDSNGLSINGGTFRLYQTGTTTAYSTNGSYNLIGYNGSIGGAGTSALAVDATTQVGGKTYSFGTFGGFVTLLITTTGTTPNFWNVDADGNWTTGSNWTLNTAPNAVSAIASFGGGGAVLTAPRTVTLNANQTVGTVTFNSAQSYTISGANTLTLNNGADPVAQITNGGGNHTIATALAAVSPTTQLTVVNAADTLTISGALSGSTNVLKTGSGTLLLSGANTYTGTTTINSGTVALAGSGNLGNTSNPLAITNGALELGGTSQTTGTATLAGATVSNGTLTPVSTTVIGTSATNISANLAGSGGITKNDTGTVTLSGNNSYTGATIINNGVLALASVNALGNPATALQFNGGALQVDGTALTNLGASHALTNFPTAVNITDFDNNFTIPQSVTVANTLIKQGPGTLTLTGTNVFSGTTSSSVQNGTLTFSGGSFTGANVTSNVGLEIAPVNGSTGTVNVENGAVITSNRIIISGNTANNAGGTGVLNMTGGTINSAQWFHVGHAGTGNGTFNMSGGTLNANSAGGTQIEIGAFNSATGVMNVSGTATVNVLNSGSINLGNIAAGTGSGTVNQSGGTVTFYSDAGTTIGGTGGLRLGGGTGRTGTFTYNLDGGVLTVPTITRVSGNSILNLNGGLLKAAATNANFIQDTIATNVLAGGALIDTNGFDIGIATLLNHDPFNVDPDGGLTKLGAGTLTISATNTYTGATTVSAGTLEFTVNQTLSALNIGDGATVVLTAQAPGAEPGAVFADFGMTAPLAVEAGFDGAELSSASVQAVPEPGTFGLLAAGVLGLFARRRRAMP